MLRIGWSRLVGRLDLQRAAPRLGAGAPFGDRHLERPARTACRSLRAPAAARCCPPRRAHREPPRGRPGPSRGTRPPHNRGRHRRVLGWNLQRPPVRWQPATPGAGVRAAVAVGGVAGGAVPDPGRGFGSDIAFCPVVAPHPPIGAIGARSTRVIRLPREASPRASPCRQGWSRKVLFLRQCRLPRATAGGSAGAGSRVGVGGAGGAGAEAGALGSGSRTTTRAVAPGLPSPARPRRSATPSPAPCRRAGRRSRTPPARAHLEHSSARRRARAACPCAPAITGASALSFQPTRSLRRHLTHGDRDLVAIGIGGGGEAQRPGRYPLPARARP